MSPPVSRVWLVPIGDTPLAPVHDVARDLGTILGVSAKTSSGRIVLPEEAYEPRRGQHLAPKLLARLRAVRGESEAGTRILGVANVDLFAPGLSFVFGQADIGGGVAVVSLTRLYPAFYGRPHDVDVFRRRGAIEGVHEVGHLLGIGHCTDRGCVMFFSSTMADSDRKGPRFCGICVDQATRAVAVPNAGGLEASAADGPRSE
jgi:archaemetzincin